MWVFFLKNEALPTHFKKQLVLCQAERETLLKTALQICHSHLNKLDYS